MSNVDDMLHHIRDKEAFPSIHEENFKLTNTFSNEIVEVRLLPKFKVPNLEPYRRRSNLIDLVTYYEYTTSLFDLDDTLKCLLFFSNLKGSTFITSSYSCYNLFRVIQVNV